jgi:hypothetical protein
LEKKVNLKAHIKLLLKEVQFVLPEQDKLLTHCMAKMDVMLIHLVLIDTEVPSQLTLEKTLNKY